MRRLGMLPLCLEMALLFSLPGAAQPLTPPSVPAANPHPARRPQGFLDYALGRINSTNEDYGKEVQAMKNNTVSDTVDDLYFWSNAFTLILLASMTSFLVLHLHAAGKREAICAVLIAQLWNSRMSDRIEIEGRTALYNRLIEAHNAEVERALMADSKPSADEEPAPSKLDRTVGQLEKRQPARNSSDSGKPSTAPEVPPLGRTSTDAGLIKLQQDNTLLVRRVEALKNTEANLKERLNQTASLLEQERRKNQTLKGA